MMGVAFEIDLISFPLALILRIVPTHRKDIQCRDADVDWRPAPTCPLDVSHNLSRPPYLKGQMPPGIGMLIWKTRKAYVQWDRLVMIWLTVGSVFEAVPSLVQTLWCDD